MNIVVIDGQGGKMGSAVVELLRKGGCSAEITAVGTNSLAAQAMLRAGADHAASGENPVVVAAARADIIVGPIGIIAADSLFGEITPRMALAVAQSAAEKVLIPVNKCRILVAGTQALSMGEYLEQAVDMILARCSQK